MTSHKIHGKRKTIQISDPGKILELVTSLNDESCAQLQTKINTYLVEECEAEMVLLIVVNDDRMEAFIEAIGISTLNRKNIISLSPTFNETLKSLKESIELLSNFAPDFQALVSPYLPRECQKKRVTMFPIPDKPFSVIACVINPKVQEEHVAIYIQECFLFVWPTLKKSILCEYESMLKTKCQHLLRVAKKLFSQVASLDMLMKIATNLAKQLMRAEHCSIMLVDVDKMELVDTIYSSKDDSETECRYPIHKGIVGHVINTGQLVNTRSPKEHPAFDSEIDCRADVDCKNMLCFPIREQTGIIAVGQFINKLGDPYFTGMDEELALAFSIYCGVCIIHSVVYKKLHEAYIRNTLANELVLYHMKVGDSEVTRLLECTGFHDHPDSSSLHFNSRALPLRELPCYALKMFVDLGFVKRFDIKLQKLARFILHVKKGYRDVPYHSWSHAFNVAQWAFAAIIHYKLISQGFLTELQGLMYLIAGLVHDLDHRGTTDSFNIQGQTTIAALYSSEGSVMERHHLAQAMCILNTEGCDILSSLSRKDYDRAILMLRDYILATDLANYLKNLNEYKVISLDYIQGNRVHTATLQALLMNAADHCDQVKEWDNVKKTAAAVLTEFFKQGDVDSNTRDMLMIMDRDKYVIPDLEIQFLDTICVPLFDVLGRIIPKASMCIEILESHMEKWDAAKSIFAEVPTKDGLSVLLSPELDNLIELNLIEKERLRLEAEAAAAAEQEEGDEN